MPTCWKINWIHIKTGIAKVVLRILGCLQPTMTTAHRRHPQRDQLSFQWMPKPSRSFIRREYAGSFEGPPHNNQHSVGRRGSVTPVLSNSHDTDLTSETTIWVPNEGGVVSNFVRQALRSESIYGDGKQTELRPRRHLIGQLPSNSTAAGQVVRMKLRWMLVGLLLPVALAQPSDAMTRIAGDMGGPLGDYLLMFAAIRDWGSGS